MKGTYRSSCIGIVGRHTFQGRSVKFGRMYLFRRMAAGYRQGDLPFQGEPTQRQGEWNRK